MKTLKYTLLTVLVAATILTTAQTAENGKVVITGTKFTYPLIDEWIRGFNAKYPAVSVSILQKGASADTANLFISAHYQDATEIKSSYHLLKIARYGILPITNRQNPWLETVNTTGLDKKRVKSIFFTKDYDVIYSDEKNNQHPKEASLTIYTRDQRGCAPIAFANYFNLNQENINGKRILGDDKGLIAAIAKDSSGITYNNLGYIYDLQTRHVQSPIAIIPIDQNGNGKLDEEEKIYENLDALLYALESGKTKNIPLEYVTIAVPDKITEKNNNIRLFAEYILNEGQESNKKYGFLSLSLQEEQRQKEKLGPDEASIKSSNE
jgi:phosphate transport system substrate-binding protein